MALLQCYNKGCGQKFNPDENTDKSCQYHSGHPVFHDALKGWSCCSKRSTDFTQFLNFQGCTTGPHSNVKPPEPEKQETPNKDSSEIIVVEAPKPHKPKPRASCERPSCEEPMRPLKVTVGSSLKTELDKLKLVDKLDTSEAERDSEEVTMGTQCRNNACKGFYRGPESKEEDCWHHPGFPVFHEGMKFWTCCQRKTSDFNNFLSQEGCTKVKHVWKKTKEQQAAEAQCRVDWHQTRSVVCISIFSKLADPELSCFEANQVVLKVTIVFNKGSSLFQQTFNLREAIIVENSEVRMLGTKVEINLKKAEPFPWPTLEILSKAPATHTNGDSE